MVVDDTPFRKIHEAQINKLSIMPSQVIVEITLHRVSMTKTPCATKVGVHRAL